MQEQSQAQGQAEDVVEIISAQNAEQESNPLDPQTLENLAVFLSHDNQLLKQDTSEITESEQLGSQEKFGFKQNSPSAGDRDSRSRSRSREKSQKRWVYCCSKCKRNDKKGKTCVCVVPASQRRISINKEGCSCCGCIGCSKEDVQMRHEKEKKNLESIERSDSLEKMRNGCCKECMKAFSSIKKACVCQVPASVRRRKIPENGCQICGCFGCNPEDTQKLSMAEEGISEKDFRHTRRSENNYKARTKDRINNSESVSMSRSRSVSRSPSRSRSRSPNGGADFYEAKYDNLDHSYIGNFLKNTFNLYLPLIGFGIPQRTYSYIHGKPPSR